MIINKCVLGFYEPIQLVNLGRDSWLNAFLESFRKWFSKIQHFSVHYSEPWPLWGQFPAMDSKAFWAPGKGSQINSNPPWNVDQPMKINLRPQQSKLEFDHCCQADCNFLFPRLLWDGPFICITDHLLLTLPWITVTTALESQDSMCFSSSGCLRSINNLSLLSLRFCEISMTFV